MAYMCIKSNRECDGCMACRPEPRCTCCNSILDDSDIEKDDGLCYVCRDELEEEEENEDED